MAQRAINMPAMTDKAQARRAMDQRKKLDALIAMLSRQLVTEAPCPVPALKDAGAWMSPQQMLALFSDRVETSHLCAYLGCSNALGGPSLRRCAVWPFCKSFKIRTGSFCCAGGGSNLVHREQASTL